MLDIHSYRVSRMNVMGRRQFCAVLGAGFSGVLIAGCSSSDSGTPPTAPPANAALTGLVFEVRRDPG